MSLSSDAVPTMTVEDLHARLHSEHALQVVDVREEWEWAQGHIAGAVHMPLQTLPDRLGELDPTGDVAFICHLGARSEIAVRYGLRHGLSRVINVLGGMDAWEARAYQVE